MKEQLYTDFTNKVLPMIQEGLVVTQEYFMDLFGRYIKYLIVTDTMLAITGLILMIVAVVYFKPLWKMSEDHDAPIVVVLLLPTLLGAGMFFSSLNNLFQDIYIPEVRVYQKLKPVVEK